MFSPVRQFVQAAARRCVKSWHRAGALAAARGGAWVLGAIIAADAAAVGVSTRDRNVQSVIDSILSAPWQRGESTGCWFPSDRDLAVVVRNSGSGWCIQPLSATPPATLWLQTTAQIHITSPLKQSEGIWSPWLETTHPRSIRLMIRGSIGEWEEAEVYQALIDAWPALAAVPTVAFAQRPLEPWEVEAIKSGTSPVRRSINWLWLANDLFVIAAGFLLCASHPARQARWRQAAAERVYPTRCPQCRYDLTGVPSSFNHKRTCPECGGISAARI